MVLIAAPDHRLARVPAPIPTDEIAREIVIMREPGSGTRAAIERHFAAKGVDYLLGCEFNTNEAIKLAVQAGLGLAVVSEQTIEIELETRRLVVLAVEGFPLVRRWYVVHRRDKRLSAAASAFVELLMAQKTLAGPDEARPVRRTRNS